MKDFAEQSGTIAILCLILREFCDRNRSSHKCRALTISIAHGVAADAAALAGAVTFYRTRKEEPNSALKYYRANLPSSVSSISRNDVHIDTTLNRVTVSTTKAMGHSFRLYGRQSICRHRPSQRESTFGNCPGTGCDPLHGAKNKM